MTMKITRINQIAKEKPNEIFTSIYHLINKELLEECFNELDGNKATGIDNITKDEYLMNKEKNLEILLKKLKNKSYRPSPARKVNIPKSNGKVRGLAIANFEDKIVQLALMKLIEAIYEPKFTNNMFGFRPGRGCHDALRQISIDIERHFTNYVVEADIKGYFDNINHKKLIDCLKLHIKDQNVLMLVKKFLKVGILENGKFQIGEYGTPQGSILSPVLANIYMYYLLIIWFEDTVKKESKGFASIINYADDFICCFQNKSEAEKFYKELLPKRLKNGGLELALDKTRMIELGRFAISNCKNGKPKTFDFLGFTHYCSTSKNGKFRVKRKTSSKKFRKKLFEFNAWCKDNRNLKLDEIMIIFKKKLIGHYNYFGITDNYHMIQKYQWLMNKILFKWLNRRSQRKSYTLEEFLKMTEEYNIPKAHICVSIYNN